MCIGNHLTEQYFGTLLSACACDAQSRIFPIAFAVMELEKKDSWSSFLVQTWDGIIGIVSDVDIVSIDWKDCWMQYPTHFQMLIIAIASWHTTCMGNMI